MSWPAVSVGCGNFGGIGSAPSFFGRGQDEAEAAAIMDAAWAHGLRWFDTADAYGGGRSESYIGRWRAARRPEGLLLTTKVFNPVTGDPGDRGLGPDRIRRQVAGSLERLGVGRIDLYLAHEPDPETPVAETVAAFERLEAEGLIGAWGLSNVGAAELEHALAEVGGRGTIRLVARGTEPALARERFARTVDDACGGSSSSSNRQHSSRLGHSHRVAASSHCSTRTSRSIWARRVGSLRSATSRSSSIAAASPGSAFSSGLISSRLNPAR